MKNKKAFTLVELIAVIIIIGIIALIAIPTISQYIEKSKNTTFSSYEQSMRDAAKNQVLKCLNDNDGTCQLPNENEKKLISLLELVDSGLIDEMKNPEENKFCETDISYVEVMKNSKNDYEYTACLYCGNYKTEDASCTTYTQIADNDDPVCGNTTGESTRWTKSNRTISVECSDVTSGCTRDVFYRTFTQTTKDGKGKIVIVDNSGKSKECEVNAYVDKTLPVCETDVIEGEYLEQAGWYIENAKVGLINYSDEDSGLLTYGMGLSLNNREYNKLLNYTVGSGITTVFGYVKDNAGNEGTCVKDVKVGGGVPEFTYLYGYNIFTTNTNDTEKITYTGITNNGNVLTTTNTNPTMTITGLSKYKNVEKVVITLNSSIPKTTTATIASGSMTASAIMTKGKKEIIFKVPKNTYSSFTIKLGSLKNKTYKISRIDLLTDNGTIWTNKNVTAFIDVQDKGIKTTSFSFDNGASWQETMQKTFTANVSNKIKVKNMINIESLGKSYTINGIDKINPSCSLKITSGTLDSTNTRYLSNVKIEFNSVSDTGGSGVSAYGIESITGNKSLEYTTNSNNTVTVTGYITDKAGNQDTCTISFIKNSNLTLTYDSNEGEDCSPETKTISYGSTYGTLCTPTRSGYTFTGWYTDPTNGTKIESSTKVTTKKNQTLYAHWSPNQYTITFNVNGGDAWTSSTCGSPSTFTSSSAKCTKKVTYESTYGNLPIPTRSGYKFSGWYTTSGSTGGSKISKSTSVYITENTTYYARWILIDNRTEIDYIDVCTSAGARTDPWDSDYCVFSGKNPDNYVKFNDQLYRIVNVYKKDFDTTGQMQMKIIYQDSTMRCEGTIPYDNLPTNETEAAEKCYYKLNDENGSYYKLVGEEWKTYVDTTSEKFYYGKVHYYQEDNANISDAIAAEKTKKGAFFAGLLQVSDYIKASNSPYCADKYEDTDITWSLINQGTASLNICKYKYCCSLSKGKYGNWLYNNGADALLLINHYLNASTDDDSTGGSWEDRTSIIKGGSGYGWTGLEGHLSYDTRKLPVTAKPVHLLKKTVRVISGSGTKTDPYIIANIIDVTLDGNGATTHTSTSTTVNYYANTLNTINVPERKYTVSFDKNSTGATATTTALNAYYTFNGWYTIASGGKKVASNAAIPALKASVSGYTDSSKRWIKEDSAKLYAQWTSNSVKLPTITKTGYECTWNTKSNGSGTSYSGNTNYTPTKNITLYAICIPNCDTGYEYSSGNCTKTYSPTSDCKCDTGYNIQSDGKTCLKTATPTCSTSGYSYNSTSKKCEKIETVAATPQYTGGTWKWDSLGYDSWDSAGVTEKYDVSFKGRKTEFSADNDYKAFYTVIDKKTGDKVTAGYVGNNWTTCNGVTCNNDTVNEICFYCPCGCSKNQACKKSNGSTNCIKNGMCGAGAYAGEIAERGNLKGFAKCKNSGGTISSYECDSNCTKTGSGSNTKCNCTLTETPICSTAGYTFNSTSGKCETSKTCTTTYNCDSGSTHAGATVTISSDNKTCTSTYTP